MFGALGSMVHGSQAARIRAARPPKAAQAASDAKSKAPEKPKGPQAQSSETFGVEGVYTPEPVVILCVAAT